MPLTEAQLKQIQAAIDVLNTIEGMPQFEGLGDSLAKIGLLAYDTKTKPCFGLQQNEFLAGIKYITPLFNAIQYETVLKITYQAFDEEAKVFVLHPQYLKQYNNRWFILGMEQNRPDQVWILALDRIQDIDISKDYTYVKLDMDWNDYFYDIIGVTNIHDAPVEKIHFLVHDKTAHYLFTKPLHGSQVAKWIDDNTLDITLKVKINYELKRLLLSYAADITILSPQSLVDSHKESLRMALEQYK